MDTASEANAMHVVFTLILGFSKSLKEHSNKSTFFMAKDCDTLAFNHYYIFRFNNDKSIDNAMLNSVGHIQKKEDMKVGRLLGRSPGGKNN